MGLKKESGFSLPEIMIVLAVAMVVAGASLPFMFRVIGDVQLRSSVTSFASLLQQSRMRAVRDNKYYSVIPNNALSGTFRDACLDLNWNGTCDPGEPLVQLAQSVSLANGQGTPTTTAITCGANGPSACPNGVTGLNFIPQATNVNPTFNQRGLPCVGNPPTTSPTWPNSACFITNPAAPNAGVPVGFLYLFQFTGILGANYGAVAVTPAGRVTVWMYEGRDANGNDVWSR